MVWGPYITAEQKRPTFLGAYNTGCTITFLLRQRNVWNCQQQQQQCKGQCTASLQADMMAQGRSHLLHTDKDPNMLIFRNGTWGHIFSLCIASYLGFYIPFWECCQFLAGVVQRCMIHQRRNLLEILCKQSGQKPNKQRTRVGYMMHPQGILRHLALWPAYMETDHPAQHHQATEKSPSGIAHNGKMIYFCVLGRWM